jgi:hypothetical protein
MLVQQYVVLDPVAVQAVTPGQLETYLLSKGWVRAEDIPPARQVWTRPDGEPLPAHLCQLPAHRGRRIWPGYLMSPTRRHKSYVDRVDELLVDLALFERRLAPEVLMDICGTPVGNPLDRIADLRGCLADGYTSDEVEWVFGRLEEATGVRLLCLWDCYDAYGYGGDSQFYVEGTDSRLYELAGDLWAWLNGEPAAADTPNSPGEPSTWQGATAVDVPEPSEHDDLYNRARLYD